MTTRPKLYYPDNQITTGLYTSGKEFMTDKSVEYKGYYHMYSDGMIMSGPEYDPIYSIFLFKIVKPDILKYNNLVDEVYNYKMPILYFPNLSSDDYMRGFFYRYFVCLVNNSFSEAIEISEDSYQTIGMNGGIDPFLYKSVKITWQISGNIKTVQENNIKSILKSKSIMPTIVKKLDNPLEFYKK